MLDDDNIPSAVREEAKNYKQHWEILDGYHLELDPYHETFQGV